MTTLKTLLLASLVSAMAWSTSLWADPAGSEVDRIDGVIDSVTVEPGYPAPPRYDRPGRSERPYRPDRPGRYDGEYERERREFPMHSRRIDERQHRQASRIESAYKEGRLTHRDYMELKREQNDIHRIEASMKADMRLSRREIARLEALLDEAADHYRALSTPRYIPRY